MFKKLINLLFPSTRKDNSPNYYYFEDAKKHDQAAPQAAKEALQSALNIKELNVGSMEEKYEQAFYNYLFGQSPPTQSHDELSLYVANKIEKAIRSPKYILDDLPVLPASISSLITQLNDEEFNTDELIHLIDQEPVIAAKVIELANSSFYNHSQKEITDLKSAFMLLGTNGLIEGVINGFISKLTPKSQIYFKQYGNKIWEHSLQTGIVAKTLVSRSVHKERAAAAYLIGLLCNLGDMIIFQLLIEAFSHVHPDNQPNSFAFKNLMLKNSKRLTYFIAKHWQFPESILDSLALQAKLEKSSMLQPLSLKRPVGCFVYEANIISALKMRFIDKDATIDELNQAKAKLVYSEEAKRYLDDLMQADITERQESHC